MLLIKRDRFAAAVEAMMIAARDVTDVNGLRVYSQLPKKPRAELPDDPVAAIKIGFDDYAQIQRIVFGAIVALIGPANLADEIQLSGFGPAADGDSP